MKKCRLERDSNRRHCVYLVFLVKKELLTWFEFGIWNESERTCRRINDEKIFAPKFRVETRMMFVFLSLAYRSNPRPDFWEAVVRLVDSWSRLLGGRQFGSLLDDYLSDFFGPVLFLESWNPPKMNRNCFLLLFKSFLFPPPTFNLKIKNFFSPSLSWELKLNESWFRNDWNPKIGEEHNVSIIQVFARKYPPGPDPALQARSGQPPACL